MTNVLLIVALVLLALILGLTVMVWLRMRSADSPLAGIERGLERLERAMREDLAQARNESQNAAKQMRDDTGAAVKDLRETVMNQLITLSKLQHERLESSAGKIDKLTEQTQQKLDAVRTGIDNRIGTFSELLTQRLTTLTERNDKKLEALRGIVDERLKAMQVENAQKLEQMRNTVDEKLQGTLEKRLGESFKIVSERLEQVHKGLGEMQNLASGVGDLKRVLTNVKTRGIWGEIQLENLLEQFLSPEQYGKNVAIRETSGERVEFAIKLPGRDDDDSCIWLPIDAKFPIEDYQRLVDAHDRADVEAIEAASKALEQRVKACAKDICTKYIHPPHSTAFAYMYLPIDGLYAEVTRRIGLTEMLRREYKVEVAGPHTLPAMLSSLQMGFRTLAIQKRSSEVWKVLGQIKTEFGKYGDVLAKVQKKLQEASNTIDKAQTRTRVINRRLKHVEALPASTDAAQPLLVQLDDDETIAAS